MVVTPWDNKSVELVSNAECVTRDGVVLRADVYHPGDGQRYPVLLCRTPYNKLTPRYVADARALAARGYTVVVQDQRGRYASDGEYRWMFRDKTETTDVEDGYDTVEWAARLEWSDGRVGTWGHSNASYLAWLLFSSQPPSLKAALASGMCENLLDLTFGIFETGRRLEWTYMMAADVRRRLGGSDGATTPAEATRRWHSVEKGKYIWWLPLGDIPGEIFSSLDEQLQAYHRAQNKEFMRFGEIHSKINVPMMQITGWWDRLIGTVDNFAGIRERSAPDVRDQHRLIIGPWGHDPTQFIRKIGPIDYGPEADTTYHKMIGRWYDYQFKGLDNGMAEEEPVQIWVLGEDKWRGESEWPLKRAVETNYHLRSAGRANTVWGDGALSLEPPVAEETFDTYVYDPRDPLMSLMREDAQAAPVDQSPHDHRRDVLVYQTPPLESDVEVVGPVKLVLHAATDGPDTDWTAKLAVVFEDGLAVNLTYGIMRAQYRDGYGSPKLLEPGKVYEYEIKLNPVGCLFKRGQRIRLYISSSDFPNFDRNHNTGSDYWSDTELRVAKQRVFHDAARPSRLQLPIIKR